MRNGFLGDISFFVELSSPRMSVNLEKGGMAAEGRSRKRRFTFGSDRLVSGIGVRTSHIGT